MTEATSKRLSPLTTLLVDDVENGSILQGLDADQAREVGRADGRAGVATHARLYRGPLQRAYREGFADTRAAVVRQEVARRVPPTLKERAFCCEGCGALRRERAVHPEGWIGMGVSARGMSKLALWCDTCQAVADLLAERTFAAAWNSAQARGVLGALLDVDGGRSDQPKAAVPSKP